MAISKRHRILIATDGSAAAQAAIAAAVKFPWGASARARAVVARSESFKPDSEHARVALARTFDEAADNARGALSVRWKTIQVVTPDEPPVEAILGEAQRFDASVIVLGWRGHGTFHRLLAGSVSRGIAANAQCAVLVARQAPRAVRRFIVGYDGCPNAQRAIELLCSLEPGPGSRAVLVSVVDPVSVPRSASLMPASARAHIRHEVSELNEERSTKARQGLEDALARLKRCGWSATGELRTGAPLERLLTAVEDTRGDVLILGARAVSGLERALLGSVANGALDRSSVPVLLVR